MSFFYTYWFEYIVKLIIQILFLALFIAAQLYFIASIIFDKGIERSLIFLFVIMLLLMLAAYKQHKKLHLQQNTTLPYPTLPLFWLGTLLTVIAQNMLGFNAVLSAGITGLLGFNLSKLNIKGSKAWAPAMYCGAFVGMTHTELGYGYLALSSILASFFYLFTQDWFYGIGGKLGTIAFMGVLYSYIIYRYIII